MDFNIDQQDCTQFVYILPYDSNTLLVELTRFSENPITGDGADRLLRKYIERRFGSFSVLHVERGQIPMSSATIMQEEKAGFISIGGRGGAIKPSTGYAFKNMFLQAETICLALKKKQVYAAEKKAGRFMLYDRLLLFILSKQPSLGKPIFEALFKKNNARSVLHFLDEKTSLREELSIFLSLPKKAFLSVFFTDLFFRHRNKLPAIIVILVAIGLWFSYSFFPEQYSVVEPWLLGIGLLRWGIPHGAVDHLIERDNQRHNPGITFVVIYLLAVFLFAALWMLFAPIALVIFLLYSIWHFGEGDLMEWNQRSLRVIKAWCWGMIPLGAILLSHINETNIIVQEMGITPLPLDSSLGNWLAFSIIVIGMIWSALEKQLRMFLCCIVIVIGTSLPLLTAFGLYFIGQHSYISWSHIKTRLKLTESSLYTKALPFTIGALLLLVVLAFILMNDNTPTNQFDGVVKNFFIFISCISFPHVLVMHRFYKTKQKQ